METSRAKSITKRENLLSKEIIEKAKMRRKLKELRDAIPASRRNQASQNLFTELAPLLDPYNSVLSFCSFRKEIDMTLLNQHLAQTQKLLLPKMDKGSLRIFSISHLETQLTPNPYGLLEPIAELCSEISPSQIEIALIPALGFSKTGNRIGYGKGYYDRFLPRLQCPTLGIGFKEQAMAKLPLETTDFPVERVLLF